MRDLKPEELGHVYGAGSDYGHDHGRNNHGSKSKSNRHHSKSKSKRHHSKSKSKSGRNSYYY